MTHSLRITIIGGGLAGCEAAWQLAENGFFVDLYEMRPGVSTGAHKTPNLAELVCSNSLGSTQPDRASGILINELKLCKSLVLNGAYSASLPAGNALAVDRDLFSSFITEKLFSHPKIKIIRREVIDIPPGPTIVASGPLTSLNLMNSIARMTGKENLFFFDALAPIVIRDSINMEIAYFGSRFNAQSQDVGDYINCPFSKTEYDSFVNELINAQTVPLREFDSISHLAQNIDDRNYFEGCLPIEILANRGIRSLAFGPMRPIGLKDPRTGKGSYAVIQLRRDNLAGSLYNIVGFQTNLTYIEQKRIFRMIPGLENVEFARLGQMHRNSFLCSPKLINPSMQYKNRDDLFFAGQITGVEGYLGNVGTGIVAAWNISRYLEKKAPLFFPRETLIGSLCHYVANTDISTFQPMKANLGILPELAEKISSKKLRANEYSVRSYTSLQNFISTYSVI